jgi:hypothetical protein
MKVLQRALDGIYTIGIFHYILQGGELLVNPPCLEAIIGGCFRNETYLNIVGDGWTMTEDRIH